MDKGKIILIFGISAVGKTYYKNLIIKRFKLNSLNRVLTRKRRTTENRTYDMYVTKEKFNEMKTNKEFFIDANIDGEDYGFLKSDIMKINNGDIFVGDCYYKLIDKLKEKLKENLITICIQPKNILESLNKIEKERKDFKKRVVNAKEEYEYWQNNQSNIDYLVYTEYNKKTDKEVMNIVSSILNKKNSKIRKE